MFPLLFMKIKNIYIVFFTSSVKILDVVKKMVVPGYGERPEMETQL